jgi:hypothetical protein
VVSLSAIVHREDAARQGGLGFIGRSYLLTSTWGLSHCIFEGRSFAGVCGACQM